MLFPDPLLKLCFLSLHLWPPPILRDPHLWPLISSMHWWLHSLTLSYNSLWASFPYFLLLSGHLCVILLYSYFKPGMSTKKTERLSLHSCLSSYFCSWILSQWMSSKSAQFSKEEKTNQKTGEHSLTSCLALIPSTHSHITYTHVYRYTITCQVL